MENASVAYVRGEGKVDLILTSSKTLTLYKVQHVSEVRKNLISGSLLIRDGYKIIFESNKVVVTKNDNFIGRGYVSDGLFELDITKIEGNKISSSIVYNIVSSDLWYGRLGHVNHNTIKRMMNSNLIPKYNININEKYEICI